MERFDKLPQYLKNAISATVKENMWDREYIDGYMEGVVEVYEMMQSFEEALEGEALKRTEEWFETEIVQKTHVDQLYTDELQERHGYVFLSNVRDEWAYEFFAHLEWERKLLRDVYCQKGNPQGGNPEENI